MSSLTQFLPFVIGAIFGGGIVYARLKAAERGLNGIGRKLNKSLIADIVTAETVDERWELAHFYFDM